MPSPAVRLRTWACGSAAGESLGLVTFNDWLGILASSSRTKTRRTNARRVFEPDAVRADLWGQPEQGRPMAYGPRPADEGEEAEPGRLRRRLRGPAPQHAAGNLLLG